MVGRTAGSRLSVTKRRSPGDGSDLAIILAEVMRERRLKQGDVADLIGVERSYVTKLLSGERKVRDVDRLHQIAGALDLPPERFGLLPDPSSDSRSMPAASPAVAGEADEWRRTRQSLNHRRAELSKHAASLYPDAQRLAGSCLLTTAGWMPSEPVELSAVDLTWSAESPGPAVRGDEAEAAAYLPHMVPGDRYPHYSRAIRDLDAPSLFENRGSYRLLDLVWPGAGGKQLYGYATYFDMVDVCEVAAHELAAVWLQRGSRRTSIKLDDLPFRAVIGDPFDLRRRVVVPSIDTLTVRYDRSGQSSFLLHRRRSQSVAVAGGLSHVMPAGVFQPSGIAPWNMAGDFDLWRNMLREFSEEFLGNPEHDGSSGEPIDYDREEPFASLNEARRAGTVRSWCFGIGLDPLTLAGEILTVVVIDAAVFDRVFAGLVAANSEGDVAPAEEGPVGLPWRRDVVYRLLATEPLAPAAAACIELAWQHWDSLVGR